MSLALIEAEILRFLSTDTPEVLCIKGKWGVGKTYCWREFLNEARRSNALAMKRYAYVSLFGLNSLDDLRYALFENTVTGENIGKGPDAATFDNLVKDKDVARRFRPLIEWASAAFNRKGVTDLLFKSAFLMVRSQLICLDDLERAGSGLGPREVLGLASLLKEERKCKIVLLLNDEEHDAKREFERQLEKVADVTLLFDLTPSEAVAIGLTDTGKATEFLRPRIVELGITNIRVIKKIERLAVRLVDLLTGRDEAVIRDGIATLALASWSVQQPKLAPPVAFLRTYNAIALAMRAGRETLDPDTERYRKQLANYPFRGPNVLDLLIMDGAEAGYFLENPLIQAADQIIAERKRHTSDAEFSRAWEDLYHGSLATDDDEFLDALYKSAIAEAAGISPLNINSAIRLLRECGRNGQANEVVANYIAAHDADGPEFFNIGRHHFGSDGPPDPGLREAFATRRAAHIDARDPIDVLRAIGERQGWSESDAILMAKQSADDFERMFETLRGKEMRRSIEMIRVLGHQEGADVINKASLEALRRIAAKSELRARKIRGLGINLELDAAREVVVSPVGARSEQT